MAARSRLRVTYSFSNSNTRSKCARSLRLCASDVRLLTMRTRTTRLAKWWISIFAAHTTALHRGSRSTINMNNPRGSNEADTYIHHHTRLLASVSEADKTTSILACTYGVEASGTGVQRDSRSTDSLRSLPSTQGRQPEDHRKWEFSHHGRCFDINGIGRTACGRKPPREVLSSSGLAISYENWI